MQANTWLDKWVVETPEKVYLYFQDEKITYRKLHETVNRVASYLTRLGVNKGDRVALYLRNSPHFLYSWFALNRIGAVIVPINTAFLARETAYILKDSGAIGVIAEESAVEEVILPIWRDCPELRFVVSKGKGVGEAIPFSEMVDAPGEVPYRAWPDDELAAILYTSGTTGHPKGVMCPHRYYQVIGEAHAKALEITSSDRLFTCLPLFHMNAQTLATMGSLVSNASLILLDGFHASTFWKDIRSYGATIFYYLGSILPVLMKLPVTDDEKNHHVRVAVGAQADPKLFNEYERRWNITMIELYGMTEGGGTINPLHARRIGSCGKAMENHEVRVVDEHDQDKPVGEVGEIIFRGPSLTLGYWNNPEATAEAYRNGWMHSGDLGYFDADGYLYFVDRKKDIIRRSGENISSAEVEKVLMSHPKIVEAAAIPVPDAVRDEEVKVYIVLKEGETPETVPPTEIIQWCESQLARFKVPRYIEYREALPKTLTQKIQKSVLKKEKEDLTKGSWDRVAGQWL